MKETQTAKILAALQAGDDLTPLGALARFGCNRLAARIHDLKVEGYEIESEMVEVTTREGGVARVARYSLTRPGELHGFGGFDTQEHIREAR